MLAWTLLSYLGVAVAAILAYEIVRSIIKRKLKRRLEQGLLSFLETPDLYAQSFKFTNKLVIKQILLADPEVTRKILEFAQREKKPALEVREKVAGYLEEIIPAFNLLTYYKVGYGVARAFIHLLYDPVVDEERRRVLSALPKDATPVFVMNHRSNVDFVLLGYILAGRASVSYAMGEWARVWPLEHLFKSFGSYLVRRGFKEDLYHKVLERYVQLQAKHGVTQAIFPEGNITRDGRLLAPKFGMLQFLAGTLADPEFNRDLVFVPVGVNYDWVLEDYNLVAEASGRSAKVGLWKKFQVLVAGPFVFFGVLIVNGVRRWTGRLKLHGYASLSFGEPVALRAWAAARGADLASLTYDGRKPHVQALGEEVLAWIGRAIPATPVCILSIAILDHPQPEYSTAELVTLAASVRRELEEKGVRVVGGREFQRLHRTLNEIPDAGAQERRDIDEVTQALVRQEEAELIVRQAVDLLRRHKILRRRNRRYSLRPGREGYLQYYANSLAHAVGRAYPFTKE